MSIADIILTGAQEAKKNRKNADAFVKYIQNFNAAMTTDLTRLEARAKGSIKYKVNERVNVVIGKLAARLQSEAPAKLNLNIGNVYQALEEGLNIMGEIPNRYKGIQDILGQNFQTRLDGFLAKRDRKGSVEIQAAINTLSVLEGEVRDQDEFLAERVFLRTLGKMVNRSQANPPSETVMTRLTFDRKAYKGIPNPISNADLGKLEEFIRPLAENETEVTLTSRNLASRRITATANQVKAALPYLEMPGKEVVVNPAENFPGGRWMITFEIRDRAMGTSLKPNPTNPFGGIDFNAANLNLRIKRDGKGVPLPLAQQDMAQISNLEGLEPVLLEIQPAAGSPLLAEFAKATP